MPAPTVTTAFEDVGKAGEIGVDIGLRLDQRVAHAGLRGQMNHMGKRCSANSAATACRSAISPSMKRKPSCRGEHRAARLFQTGIVVGVQIVETDDTVPILEQPPCHVKANKAGGSGHQNCLGHGNQSEKWTKER